MTSRTPLVALFSVLVASLAVPPLDAGTGEVIGATKISDTTGVPGLLLADGDRFGAAVCAVGDLDGNGVVDFAIGAPGDDQLGSNRGAVYVLLMNADRSVLASRKINDAQGGLTGGLANEATFGSALTSLGDLDGDGRRELAVGAPATANAAVLGRVFLLRLDAGGFVTSQQVITQGSNGFGLPLTTSDPFGRAVGVIGDLDGNGTDDLAIGGTAAGDIYAVRLNPSGVVTNHWRIGNNVGGFGSSITPDFGSSLVGVGDLNSDGIPDLAVGDNEETCYACPGGYWLLSMNSNGTVASEIQTRGYDSIYGAVWETRSAQMGDGIGALGDLTGDGIPDLVVGGGHESNASCNCSPDPDQILEAGALWLLQMNADGTPGAVQKINADEGNLPPFLETMDHFGTDVDGIGDFGGDGIPDLLAGAPGDDDGGTDRGAVYLLELEGLAFPAATSVYNGTHQNRLCLSSLTLPRLGSTWSIAVDAAGHPGATLSAVYGYALAQQPPLYVFGQQLLVDPGSVYVHSAITASSGGLDQIDIAVPPDPAFLALTATFQGFLLGGSPELCSALTITIGN